MKLDKEKFDKLKQLDRIEFRQKYDGIERISFWLGDLFWYIIILCSIFIVGYLVSLNESMKIIAIGFLNLSVLLIFLTILSFIIEYFVKSHLKEKLFKEYFKIEVKK